MPVWHTTAVRTLYPLCHFYSSSRQDGVGVAGQSHRHVVMGFTDDSTQPTVRSATGARGFADLETDTPTGSVWRPTGQPIRGSVCSREGVPASRGRRGGAFQRRGVQRFLPAQEFRKTHTSSMLGVMCWDRLLGDTPSGHKHFLGHWPQFCGRIM